MEKSDNRTVGGKFENELSEVLAKRGFWAHVCQQSKAGQPADIIAVKGRIHTLIDAKVISDHDGFPFSRAEENQRLAMDRFIRRAKEMCYFALKLPDKSVWFLPYSFIKEMEYRGKKGISEANIRKELMSLESWLEATETWSEDI